jgi:hypothetical protein
MNFTEFPLYLAQVLTIIELMQQRATERCTVHLLLEELGHEPPPDEQIRLRKKWHLD